MSTAHSIRLQRLSLFALACFLTPCCPAESTPPTQRPNVLLILVDDLNTGLGCYGNVEVKSPHIDRLAQQGVRFERAYSHYPICHPSRTALLSGRRPGSTRILNNETPARRLLPNVAFLPEYFQQHGYFTARVGKIAHYPQEVRWDVDLNPPRSAGADEAAISTKRPWRATRNRDEDEPDGSTAPRVVQLLERHKDKAFFVAAGFDKPHLPFVAPKKYFDLYPLDKISVPKEPANVRKNVPRIAFTLTRGPWRSEAEHRQFIAAYYACVSFIDAQVGILLEGLQRLGLTQKTIICFTSDHGFHLGEHGGLWRKSTLFEQSAQVPLIMVVPGMPNRAAISPRVIEHVDLYPTLLELCGLAQPPGLEGRSFVPLLKDPMAAWDEPAITLLIRSTLFGKVVGQSLRTERWRYTEWNEGRRGVELYDHATDPYEFINLAKDPQHTTTVAELKGLLRRTVSQPEVKGFHGAGVVVVTASVLILTGIMVWVYRRRRAHTSAAPGNRPP